MGLRVNQNISAMQGHYYLQMTETSFNKALEKLSSGLRINKAADDPAGLVISEKYRAQIEGLQQAINNSQDGVGMIQTAEGALDEISKALRSMRALALHAANTGPNDQAAIDADQEQITKLKATIDRIVTNTQFGSKTLLDGSLGTTATTTSTNVTYVSAGASVAAGTYTINITQAAKKGYIESSAIKYGSITAGVENSASAAISTTATSDGISFSGDLFNGASFTIEMGATGMQLASVVEKLNASLSSYGITVSVNSANKMTFTTNRIGSFQAAATNAVVSSITGVSTNAEVATMASVNDTDLGNYVLGVNQTINFTDTRNSKSVAVQISAGSTIASAINSMNSDLAENDIGITVSWDDTAKSFKFLNTNSGAGTDGTDTLVGTGIMMSGGKTSAGLNLAVSSTSFTNIADNGSTYGGSNGQNAAGTIGGLTATIPRSSGVLASGVYGDTLENTNGLRLRFAEGATGDQGTVTIAKGKLLFQVGAFAGQSVETTIDALSATKIGTTATGVTYSGYSGSNLNVNSIIVNVSDVTAAQDAVRIIDSALSQINTVRGNLGSFQKDVLESTVRNLGIAKQNMASSESLIRDADMAQEMLNFSRAQILQQTGMAMLAQANTAPSMIMQLFR